MGRRIYRDIAIRGVTYPDAGAAARATGVTASAIRRACREGTLDRVGLGHTNVVPMRVRIRDVTYPDAGAAARAFGMTRAAVYRAIDNGTIDRFGLRQRYNPARATPFELGGIVYPSRSAADRALGFSPGFIAQALRTGSRRGRERILAAAMRHMERAA